MLPELDPQTGFLPEGEHPATWREIELRFGWNAQRRVILLGFLRAATNLRDAGCRAIYLNGSFVTAKDSPRDFDACCDIDGIAPDLVDPLLKQGTEQMKRAFGGEIRPARWQATPDKTFYEYFQHETRWNLKKGIIKLDLSTLPT